MSVARIFTPENRLGKILDGPGGATTRELVMDAERRVDSLADVIGAFVADKLKLILPFAEADDEALFAECRTLADAATQIAEVAGAAKLGAVGEIAGGIATMVDGLVTCGVWHGDALRVHIHALKAVAQARGQSELHDSTVVENLSQMRRAIGLTD